MYDHPMHSQRSRLPAASTAAVGSHTSRVLTPWLTFHDERMERAFWASALTRRNLCMIDRAAGAALIFVHVVLRKDFLDSREQRLINNHAIFASICIAASLACSVLAWVAPELHYRHRTKSMYVLRLIYVGGLYVFAHILADADGQHIYLRGAAAVMNPDDVTPSLQMYFLSKALVLRSFVIFTWMPSVYYPLSFLHNCVHALITLPVLLVAASTTGAMFIDIPFKGAVCQIYESWLSPMIFDPSKLQLLHKGTCPRFTPYLISLSFTLLFGFFAPLLVSFVIETRYRRSFRRLFTLQSRPPEERNSPLSVLLLQLAAVAALLAVIVVNVLHWVLSPSDRMGLGGWKHRTPDAWCARLPRCAAGRGWPAP